MTCPYCGFENANESGFCANCGAQLAGAQAAEPVQAPEVGYTQVLQNDEPAYTQPTYTQPAYNQPAQNSAPVYTQPVYAAKEQVPAAYKPISAWGYFGYKLLFCIPVVGFILLIVFSVSDENINRRNFARSYWCDLVLGLVVGILIGVVAGLLVGAGIAAENYYYY